MHRIPPGAPSLAPSSNRPALKKYGDSRPALVLNSPKRSTPASTANCTKSWASAVARRVRRVMRDVAVFRLVTLNLNGIRSAASQGLRSLGRRLGADCMGVQEIKAPGRRRRGPLRRDRRPERPLPLRREEGLLGRRPLHAASAERRASAASATPSSTPKAATSRRASTPAPQPQASASSAATSRAARAASSGRRPSSASSRCIAAPDARCKPSASSSWSATSTSRTRRST